MSNYNNIVRSDQHQHQHQHEQSTVYTHQLPYGVRREFCNLLDADHQQPWRLLGGKYFGLDATQLALIGQALFKPLGSPTEELLNRLDSANVRVADLCHYLAQMHQCRATEILQPFINQAGLLAYNSNHNQTNAQDRNAPRMAIANTNAIPITTTLDTPTPSFSENQNDTQQNHQLMAWMDANNDYQQPIQDNQFINNQQILWPNGNQQQQVQFENTNLENKCHRGKDDIDKIKNMTEEMSLDPGEEIVRLACTNNRKRTSISDQEVVNQLRLIMQINYNELRLASNDFSDSNILGNGGFASVYRGNWKGTDVAIKRLKCNLMDQALNELTILNSYRIDNILPIYGISIDGPEACLVYQFMSNGSLEDRLSCKKDTPPLTWTQRALIGEGVAKGLFYLHTLRDKPLVHGDVKSANVLLDSQFVPKLGDFGLARQVFKGKNPQTEICTHCTVSSIHGTSVYLPPEYLRHKILSPAVDVYSYGIVLLEMATGKRAYDGKRLLIDLVEDETQSMLKGEISYSLKDQRLDDDTQSDLKIWYELLIKLGLNCAHKIKKKRPDMGNVLVKFSEFRKNSSQGDLNQIANHPLGLIMGQSTRTLTPETSTLTSVSRNNNNNNNNRQLGGENNNNLMNLMSVEEVEEPPVGGGGRGGRIGQQVGGDGNEGAAVEAMIPLLTELGVKQE